MPLGSPIYHGYPLSKNELKKVMRQGPLYEYLLWSATRDVVHHFDDFLGDAINLDNYALANSSGTSAADFAIQVLAGGVIRGDTGTSDNGSISLVTPIIYKGDLNCGIEVRFKQDRAIAAADDIATHLEIGLIDAVPGSNTGGVNDIDTPTFYAADGAFFMCDGDQTLKTFAWATVGSTSGQPDQKTNSPTVALAAATYATARIQLLTDLAYGWLDGQLQMAHDTDPQGQVEGATLLAGWLFWQTRDTTAIFPDIDYIRLWADRS